MLVNSVDYGLRKKMVYATEEPVDGSLGAFEKRMLRSDTSPWNEKVKSATKDFLQDENHHITRHKLAMVNNMHLAARLKF